MGGVASAVWSGIRRYGASDGLIRSFRDFVENAVLRMVLPGMTLSGQSGAACMALMSGWSGVVV